MHDENENGDIEDIEMTVFEDDHTSQGGDEQPFANGNLGAADIDGALMESQRQSLLHSGTAEYYEIQRDAYDEVLVDAPEKSLIAESFTGTRGREIEEPGSARVDVTDVSPALRMASADPGPAANVGEARARPEGGPAVAAPDGDRNATPVTPALDGSRSAPAFESEVASAPSSEAGADFDEGAGSRTPTELPEDVPEEASVAQSRGSDPENEAEPEIGPEIEGEPAPVPQPVPAPEVEPTPVEPPVNEAPAGLELSGSSVAENAAGAVVGTVSAVDPDGDALDWSVDDARFEIVGETLRLRDGEALDHEAEPTVSLVLTTTDPDGASVTREVTLDVADVNEAPEDLSVDLGPVSENAAGAVVGTVSAVDPDGDALDWSVDDARFEVVGETLRLRDGEALDHEAEPTVSLVLTATDPDGASVTREVTLDVADVNEAPEDLSVDLGPVSENAAGAVVGTVSAVDPDGDALDWSVDDARLEVVGETLRLRDGEALDHEAEPAVDLVATVTDTAGLSRSISFQVEVTDEVAPPPDVTVGTAFHVRQIGVVEGVTDLTGIDWQSDPIGERFVEAVDIARTAGSFLGPTTPDAFATLVTGQVEADMAGTYTFRVPTTDTTVLWIDGSPVAVDLEPGALGLGTGSIDLEEGTHEIVIQHLDLIDDAELRLEWMTPDGDTFEITPPAGQHVVEQGEETGLPVGVDPGTSDVSSIRIEDVPADWIVSDGVQAVASDGEGIDITDWDISQLSVSPAASASGATTLTIEVQSVSPTGEVAASEVPVDVSVVASDGGSVSDLDLIALFDIEDPVDAGGLDDVAGPVPGDGEDDASGFDIPPEPSPELVGSHSFI